MFFKFSIEIDSKENQTELYKWLEHFDRTGMPAGLVRCGDMISVWRAGKRVSTGLLPTVDSHEGLLFAYVNGFEKIWLGSGGQVAKDNDRRLMNYRGKN